MIVCVSGSKSIKKYSSVSNILSQFLPLLRNANARVIIGDTAGVDSLTAEFCIKNGIPYTIQKTPWKKHGDKAPSVKNESLSQKMDMLISIWDGRSNETKDMIFKARQLNKPLCIYNLNNLGSTKNCNSKSKKK